MQTPPCSALTWPSNEVPTPKGTIGASCAAQMRTVSMTSSLVSANTTASGGATASQVKVWPCCIRTASDVTSRLPKRAASAAVSSPTVLAESLPSRRRTEENVASIIWIDLPRVAVRRAAHNAPASGHQAMGILRRGRRTTDDTPTTAKRSRPGRILWYFWRKGANDGVGMGWVDFAGRGTNLCQPRNRKFDASRREPHLHLVPRRGRRKWENPRHRNYRTNPRVADDDSTRQPIVRPPLRAQRSTAPPPRCAAKASRECLVDRWIVSHC